ncbi:1-phosphofructokinase family hexose kinase [Agrococcus sp. SGAir0287]|uniref:1-phosphofructokinase family hexose kinase n=1 Tax=Agrococcus sp. SGAir0287 TaxID=2070347 RepID=UPI0010CD569B|nr:hexose kinase [Agrococcus sp. SGAir0287]QCR19393.1 1-phosphofructokinase [Agrococcus sp. SGAir0287]
MILTITLHPSIDRTVELGAALEVGGVARARGRATEEPAGKGVNVTRTLLAAGTASTAIVVADQHDRLVAALDGLDVPTHAVHVDAPVRQNLTIVDPDGTTTKVNESGGAVDGRVREALLDAVDELASTAAWVVLAGSLPPDTDADVVTAIVAAVRQSDGARIAVDTSGAALAAAIDAGVDLVKPNEAELAELLGLDQHALDEPEAAIAAARELARRVPTVLLTLGAHGAALVTADGGWRAAPPPTVVRSTVGAGDATLAGYLHAEQRGRDHAARLAQAVAHGSAAAALPGTGIPTLGQADATRVDVHPIGHQATTR